MIYICSTDTERYAFVLGLPEITDCLLGCNQYERLLMLWWNSF